MKKTTNDQRSMTTKKLSLHKETLRALGQNELVQAAGGAPPSGSTCGHCD